MRWTNLIPILLLGMGWMSIASSSIATPTHETEEILLVRRALSRSPSSRYDPDTGDFEPVVIRGFSTYTHPSGLFSLEIPLGWELENNTQPGEVIILWFDPAQNASIGVDIFDAPEEELPVGLDEVLQFFLQGTFGKQT